MKITPSVSRWFGIVLLIVAGALMRAEVADFFRAYLFGFIFWSDIPVGCLGLIMIFHLTGGRWGEHTRRILTFGASTTLTVAVLSLPVLVAMAKIYPWMSVSGDPELLHKRGYLNPWFFSFRTLLYFALWAALSSRLRRWSNPEQTDRLAVVSAVGLIVVGFSATFAAIDWQMSAEPKWYSSVYGMVFLSGQALTAYSLMLAVFLRISVRENRALSKTVLRDLGNLLLMLVMVWTYLSFVQYLIIWSGNLPSEVSWYLHRTSEGWQWIALVIFICQFALPFLFLLFRSVKENPRALATLSILIFIIRILDHYWMLTPAFGRGPLAAALPSIATYTGVGAIWAASFSRHFHGEMTNV